MRRNRTYRDGFVLVAVLIVTLMAAMIAAGLLYRVGAETAAGGAMRDGEQAYHAAMSGIHTALAVLTTPPAGEANSTAPAPGPAPGGPAPQFIADLEQWYDNPQIFRRRLVTDDGGNRWYFTVYAQSLIDEENVRYGLIDESGKLVIAPDAASQQRIERLPGMTTPLLDSLMDYCDRDSNSEGEGAEQDFYDQLQQPYLIPNGPLWTPEELLMVYGFSGREVYGEDANFNGLLEPSEDDGDEVFPPDDADGRLNPGLAAYLTVERFSTGRDLKPDGLPKLNINSVSAEQLDALGLSSPTINAIVGSGQNRPRFRHPSELLVTHPNISTEDLRLVMAHLSAGGGRMRPGLVNPNTAPAPVLAALLDGDSGLAQQIVEARADLSADDRASTAWLYTENLLTAEQYLAVAPSLTSRGYQYRLRCIGFGVPGGRFRILEAVIDPHGPQKIAYLRDITRVGVPFRLDAETVEN